MLLRKVGIRNFKRVKSVDIELDKINILVGENDSGKSSILQAMHFSITALVTKTVLGYDTFSTARMPYMPSNDFGKLRHSTPYGNQRNADNSSQLILEAEIDQPNIAKYEIEIRRGRNDDNMSCTTRGDQKFGQLISNPKNPFSVFVPGLAGIPTKEELRSKAVVLRGIASGDSNLYLRNVLYMVKQIGKIEQVTQFMRELFPSTNLQLEFNPETDEVIYAGVEKNGKTFPIEVAGTAYLQVAQIFSYVNLFSPKLLLLDEPDSHLHPDNQKRLCDSILAISEQFETTIVISTHSKHIIEGLYEDANLIRLKNGEVKESGRSLPRLNMLMDLGAFDVYDRLKAGEVNLIVLTEDSNKDLLKTILKANEFVDTQYILVSYKGCKNLESAAIFIDFMKEVSGNVNVVVHLDRDFMTASEAEEIERKITAFGGVPFITEFSDIEAYYCNPEHIAQIINQPILETNVWLDNIALMNHAQLQHDFTRKRDELKTLYRNKPKEMPDTMQLIGNQMPFPHEKRKGKAFLKLVSAQIFEKWGMHPSKIRQYTSALNRPILQKIRTATLA